MSYVWRDSGGTWQIREEKMGKEEKEKEEK